MTTPKLSGHSIRRRFLDFFQSHGHAIIPSASLIPEHDPTLLFTNSGMHPLVPYLMGEPHPQGTRLSNSQKCVRTIDIDEVGDNRHLTFFEMLGFWSLGDYFKKETIPWTFTFMTDPRVGIGLDPHRLYVTCFAGNANVPKDTEAAQIWQQVGMPSARIYFLGREDNWWELPGNSGPCGPDTEVFYDVEGHGGEMTHEEFVAAKDDGRVVEIGNDVFMQYAKDGRDGVAPLPKKNVDVGWGLERLTVMVQGVATVFETDLFAPIIAGIERASGKSYDDTHGRAFRIIADHVRTATFIMGDPFGVGPSNVDQGYIVRRLIRRAVREGRRLGMHELFLHTIAETVIASYSDAFPELKKNRSRILLQFQEEEVKFAVSLDKGLKELTKILSADPQSISGKDAFLLFSSYGFPLEMTVELAREQSANVDEMSFDKEFEEHQHRSRAGAQTKFKGGLADHSRSSRRLHTATHLLHKALRNVLGEHVGQKGSNITPERLRFDFNYETKLTPGQLRTVEDMVNTQIKKNLPVYWKEMSVEEAKKIGAIGFFDDEYARLGNHVKVYFIGDESTLFAAEICGGPHVEHTGELGSFHITSEKSSAAGIRRIKAVVHSKT